MEATVALDRISASCSPLTMSTFGGLIFASKSSTMSDLATTGSTSATEAEEVDLVSRDLVAKTVSNVLRLEMKSDEMLPLLHSLVEALSDEVPQR